MMITWAMCDKGTPNEGCGRRSTVTPYFKRTHIWCFACEPLGARNAPERQPFVVVVIVRPVP